MSYIYVKMVFTYGKGKKAKMHYLQKIACIGLTSLFLGFSMQAHAEEGRIMRHVDPTGAYPFSTAIEVPSNSSFVYISALGPDIINKNAKPTTQEAYGNTEAQTRNVLEKLQDMLGPMNLTLGDVIKLHIFLAADSLSGKVDYDGALSAYKQFFGTKGQPNLPTGALTEVAHLPNQPWLVLVEATAVKRAHASTPSP